MSLVVQVQFNFSSSMRSHAKQDLHRSVRNTGSFGCAAGINHPAGRFFNYLAPNRVRVKCLFPRASHLAALSRYYILGDVFESVLGRWSPGSSPPFAMPTPSGRTSTTTKRNGGALGQAGRSFLGVEGGVGRSSEGGGAAAGPVKEVDCPRLVGFCVLYILVFELLRVSSFSCSNRVDLRRTCSMCGGLRKCFDFSRERCRYLSSIPHRVVERSHRLSCSSKNREKFEAEAQERERQERDSRAVDTESRLRELRERERMQIDTIEERRRERVSFTSWVLVRNAPCVHDKAVSANKPFW